MLKIIAWNIQQGGGSRTAAIIAALKATRAQIITLNEFKNNTSGLAIRIALLRSGFLHQAVTKAPGTTNSVLIASALPFDSVLHHALIDDFPYSVLSAKFKAFDVYGLYLPHKKHHTLFPYLRSQLKDQRPAILCGDFNTGYNYIDQKGKSFWYSEELDKMKEIGYWDAFRHFYPDEKTYSWYSHHGNGFRYDHIWVHQDILPVLKNCYYVQDVRKDKLSDHAMLVLEFQS